MKTSRVIMLAAAALAVAAATAVPHMWSSRGVRLLPPDAQPQMGAFDRDQSAALFVSVRRFTHAETPEVPYAVDDAADLAYMFALDRRIRLVAPERVVLAISGVPDKPESKERLDRLKQAGVKIEPATPSDIIVLLQRQAAAAGRNGLLIVSFATHGFVVEGAPHLLASTSLFRYPETSLSMARLFEIASATQAARSVFFIDACRERITRGTRSTADPATAAPLIRRMRRVAGQVVFYAAPAGGYAYDHPSGNGVFTKAVIDGLRCEATVKRGVVTGGTLRTFVERQVRAWVRKHQNPAVLAGIQVSLDGDTDNMPLSCCTSCVPPAGSPHRLAVDSTGVTAFDENRIRLWRWNAGAAVVRAEITDLDGDGAREVVVGTATRITALGKNGKSRWSVDQEQPLRAFVTGDLFRKHTRQVVALSGHEASSRLSIYSAEGGHLSTYEHAGLRHVAIDRATAQHAPKIVAAGKDAVMLLDPKRVGRGREIWYASIAPPGQRIESLEVIDRDSDRRREISITTEGGRRLLVSFDGTVIGAHGASTSPDAPRWHLRARTRRAGTSRASESAAERR